ncbi:Uma2 family endonuclease [Streptomyces gobiensis]|uniref:Uma2 family endonuclease n=1 Tax=Streptomyces gobiensis TaxID=2875706 RepID=UPI001E56E9B9|nr:Uma2 family endonuclease [Streptomyces gobiensis]UGY92834.1 Uma2 family endonuclease [Streptomyces gobiensis]
MTTDPIDLLIAFEEVADVPVRPEFVEGRLIVPPWPYDDHHNATRCDLAYQLRTADVPLVGFGNGYRISLNGESTHSLTIPDFYVLHRRPNEVDEAYRTAHKGWYSIELVALVGEVTSTDHETDSGLKYRSYAAAGVPVYVLIHREERTAYAFSDPVPGADSAKAHYATKTKVHLGYPLPLPAPFPALDTSLLLDS